MSTSLQPPVKFEELCISWSEDATIDITNLTQENSRIPKLHAKYLTILSHHRLIVNRLDAEYRELKSIKWQYYNGDMNNPEDLAEYGFEPLLKTILKQNIPIYLESDKDLNKLLLKRAMHQEIVDYCTMIIRELNNRTYQIGNMIKQEIFLSGG